MPGIRATMEEYRKGRLHSGSKHGPLVKSRKQAIAIALSEEREKGVTTDDAAEALGKRAKKGK